VRAIVLASAFVIGVLVTTETAGYADPTPGPAAIEAQIDSTWQQLEPLIEEYNKVHEAYTATQAKVAALQATIRPLQIQVDLASSRVGAVSAQAYEYGPANKFDALLQSDSPQQFLDKLTSLDEVARGEASMISGVTALLDKYDQEKRPLDAALAAQRDQDNQLSAKKQDITNRLNQLNSMRMAAYGNSPATGNLRPVACPQTYDGSIGARAAKAACGLIGHWYGWGDAGPTYYDCSGMTLAAWASVGVNLPHNAAEQRGVTTPVSQASLKVGDLVYYYANTSHVVIYVGNGWVVSAPQTGKQVQMQRLNQSIYSGAGRPRV
jgi:cell wall-associated NlpC family hydrolase